MVDYRPMVDNIDPLAGLLISFQTGDLLTVLTLSGEYPDVVATAASKEVVNPN